MQQPHFRSIKKSDYDLVLSLDKKVYPTKSPVTKAILNKWFLNDSRFGLVYCDGKSIQGICIVIPLNANGWKKLVFGKIAESELDETTLFDISRDNSIGLHVYHIEKLNPKIKKFHILALKRLGNLLSDMRCEKNKLKVIGFSGLCVTPKGISLFKNKLNCSEDGVISKEYICKKEKKKCVLELQSKNKNYLIKRGCKLINRCQMLVLFPKKESIVWEFFTK